ncbi:MAG TPA: dockerin type I repeat-containing protein [Pirellulales bacterium]|nr:dockerin type I repeat-containing protein [Pirellulales bacterium]
MRRSFALCHFAVAGLLFAMAGQSAWADTALVLRDYRFIPSESTVQVTGGIADYSLQLHIAGQFGLFTGLNETMNPLRLEPVAGFANVHGILFNDMSASPVPVATISATPLPTPGWDLDKTLNLSGLTGTFTAGDPNDLFFFGADGNGVAERFEATLDDGWLHLTGGTTDPSSSKPVIYRVDALAHLLPFPDFNGNGVVDSADIVAMQQALAAPTAYEAQHDISPQDFLSLGDVNGDGVVNNMDLQSLLDYLKSSAATAASPVPEPASWEIALAAAAALGAMFARRRK